MVKLQIPISKFQVNPKSQFPISKTKKFRSTGIWTLVIVCNLYIGIGNLAWCAEENKEAKEKESKKDKKSIQTIPLNNM